MPDAVNAAGFEQIGKNAAEDKLQDCLDLIKIMADDREHDSLMVLKQAYCSNCQH